MTQFLGDTSPNPASSWDYDALVRLSGGPFPNVLLGDNEPMLRGDQHRLWLRWFLDGLVSPVAASRDPSVQRLEILAAVLKRVKRLYPEVDDVRRKALTERIADHIYPEIERLRTGNARDTANKAARMALLAERTPARCYLCGFAFSENARDAFLRVNGRDEPVLPLLVDVFRPRLKPRDISIEVEHLVPVAASGHGQDNLRLACGWCNKHKSSRVSLYEAPFMAPRVMRHSIGPHELHELPHPFWSIRILALRGRCQHQGECHRDAKIAELFVTLADWSGSPNPTNLLVHCEEHDPLVLHRMQDRAKVAALWAERQR